MPERKKEILSYFENISLLMVGILFILFPIFFLSTTTDAFVLPKQLILIIFSSLALLIFGFKTLIEGKLRLRTSPFDVPVTLFIIIVLLSAVFSTNRSDALIASTPLLFVGFLYFVIVNVVKTQKQLLFLLGTLTIGAVLSALLTIFSYLKVYLLPFDYSHVTYFTTFGSLLDQSLYYALLLPIAGYFGYGYITNINAVNRPGGATFTHAGAQTAQKKSAKVMGAFGIAFIILALGLGFTILMLFTDQKPLILPFDVGLKTGFAALAQNNIFKSLLLGSGYGTYLTDFTRFKPISYNGDQTLWAFTFFRSSSFVLELIATAGLLGVAAFGLLIYRIVREKNFFFPLILAILASIFLPFSFTLVALFFILLSIFAVVCVHNNPERFGEAEFSLLALKKGFFAVTPEHERVAQTASERRISRVLPSAFLLIVIIIVGVPLYFVTRFMLSDFTFQQSLVAESQNNGLQTYQLQTAAITIFPYRDIYYRAFSQTNLALANALAISQPKNQKPSSTAQRNILTLIQQSISAARAAVTIAPETSFNWNNLSSIYRSLIGFGQNADKFTLLTLNQAIALDPNNPQQYLDLGGVYYQLGQFDDAIREFQLAINLKQDYANGYYNLGHAFEMKGDYTQAMAEYETVKQLVAGNQTNTNKINADIATLNQKISGKTPAQQPQQKQASTSAQVSPIPQNEQKSITVNKSSTQLPERHPPAQIPGPSGSTGSSSPTNAPKQ